MYLPHLACRCLDELQTEAEDYQEQIAAAERRADELADYIQEQNRLIEEKRRQEEENKKNEDKKPAEDGDLTDPSKDPEFTSDVSGEELVAYALQFVGNPYKWGGNSLTEGCDCSGFVHLVYKHFGYKTVRYSMSFLYEGVAVSREDVRPGDIVVYAMKNGIGHVAIYAGNGKIVEAQSKNTGITDNRSIDCREIVGIRRIINK